MSDAIIIFAVIAGLTLRGRRFTRPIVVTVMTAVVYFATLKMTVFFARPEMNPYDTEQMREAYIRGAKDAWERARSPCNTVWLGVAGFLILALVPTKVKTKAQPAAGGYGLEDSAKPQP